MSAADRFKASITAIVLELLPDLRFRAPARYVVDKCEGGKLTATPKSSKSGLPPIVDMPVRGGMAGGMGSKLKKGTSVLIAWIDASPADPFLAWIDEGQEPDELKLEGQTKATIKAPAVDVDASSSFAVATATATIEASGAATLEAGTTATLEGGTKAVVKAPMVELGNAPQGGVATALTMAPQLILEAAERAALIAFFSAPTVVAISGGMAAPAAAAVTAANVGAALPTNYSQTVKAGS